MLVYIIIIITALFSVLAFQSQDVMNKFIMYPYAVRQNNEWWRFISSGFLHADLQHLFFNMFALFFFAPMVLAYFQLYFEGLANYYFIILYLGAIIISDLPSYIKWNKSPSYRSLGASGAVSAVIFASILFDPTIKILVNFFIPLPCIIWGIIYLASSWYMARKGGDHINHDAHFYGAVFGFIFPIIIKPELFSNFIEQVKSFLS